MSLFVLEVKDMSRSPALITFDWRNGFSNYFIFWRNWRAILQISKPNLWLAFFVNIIVVGALDAAAILLMIAVPSVGSSVLIFVGFVLLMTILYLFNIIKLFNFLIGKGYRG